MSVKNLKTSLIVDSCSSESLSSIREKVYAFKDDIENHHHIEGTFNCYRKAGNKR